MKEICAYLPIAGMALIGFAILAVKEVGADQFCSSRQVRLEHLTERNRLIPMDYDDYETRSENARLARAEYLQGKLTAEVFCGKLIPHMS